MPSSRVAAVTRAAITDAARNFRWNRSMPKWSVIIEGRELPARPLVLKAAGVPPNDPTNSHQAVDILESHGLEVRYEGQTTKAEETGSTSDKEFEHLLRSLRGCVSKEDGAAILAARDKDHRVEKDRWPK